MELNIKTCCTCNRRFVVEKGFYQRSDGTYYGECKSCHNEIFMAVKLVKFIIRGRYRGRNFYIRCGLKRHKSAHMTFVGRYVNKYLINNQWEKELPPCNM